MAKQDDGGQTVPIQGIVENEQDGLLKTPRWWASMRVTESITLAGAILNFLAIVGVGILAWHSAGVATSNTGKLQRGQNTIALLSSFSDLGIDESRSAIRSFIVVQENPLTRQKMATDEQIKLYSEKFSPFVRQANLLAFCYANDLCDKEFTRSYSCDGLLGVFSGLDNELPSLDPAPSRLSESIRLMLEDCRAGDQSSNQREP